MECIDIFITQYNLIREVREYLIDFLNRYKTIIVIDEVHKAKSPLTDLRTVLDPILNLSPCLWGITATMMNTQLEDIYNIMDIFFSKPFGSKRRFQNTYIIYDKKKTVDGLPYKEIIGYKNLDLLHKILKSYLYMKFIPMPVKFKISTTVLGKEEQYNYFLAASGILGLEMRNFVSRLPDLQQTADNSIKEGRFLNDNLKYLGTKEKLLLEVLQMYLLKNKAVIVYTFFKKTLYRLKKVINSQFDMDVKTITGNTSENKRKEIEATLKERDVLIMTGAGGESLNLQASGVLIMYSLSFSIITFIQVVGRIARMDSEHEEMIVHIIEAENTIDTYKRYYLYANANLINTVIAPNPNLPYVEIIPSRKYIIKLRKNLLWKAKNANVAGHIY
jgi:superfamily II DNA or RNA helicase